jgi:hypothetical protein
MVITGAADRVRDRIRRLVYLDTFVPRDGDSMRSVAPLVLLDCAAIKKHARPSAA